MAKVDDMRRASGYSPEQLLAEQPKPQACHNCETPYAGTVCPRCKEPRPAYLALKAMSGRRA